jgi:hypothetical protein
MRRVLVIASGLALAGCTSGGMGTDWFPKFEPAPVNISFQSQPAGADAKTSTGQTCKTPCSIAMPPDKDFSVTFSLAGYQPQTVPVQVTKPDGDETALQPNPVEVELAAAKPLPKRTPARKPGTAAAKPAARPAAPRPAAASQPQQSAPPASTSSAPATDPWPPASR